jgi:hypothetical protein
MVRSVSGLVQASARVRRQAATLLAVIRTETEVFRDDGSAPPVLENPYAPNFVHGHQFVVILVLLAAGGGVPARFGEATGSAYVTDWWLAVP